MASTVKTLWLWKLKCASQSVFLMKIEECESYYSTCHDIRKALYSGEHQPSDLSTQAKRKSQLKGDVHIYQQFLHRSSSYK